MSYKVEILHSAEKELKRIPQQISLRIGEKLLALADNPRPSQAKQLHNTPHFRLRVGDYRIIYFIDDKNKKITITVIAHRKEAYR